MRFSYSQSLCILRRVVLILGIKCRISGVIFENSQRFPPILDVLTSTTPGPVIWAILSALMTLLKTARFLARSIHLVMDR